MSLFPNEDILTTKEEIKSWISFGDSLSSEEGRELFRNILNDYYSYTPIATGSSIGKHTKSGKMR